MRDFPVFTTENGVGSLVLKEIPYSGIAYITIQSSLMPEAFLQECVAFCRAVGAEKIYANGHDCLQQYPFHTAVIRMCADAANLPDTDASVFPVTEKTLARWQELYNHKMKNVHNASYLSDSDSQRLLQEGGGYFIHRDGDLLGIGIARDDKIDCVAAVKPGGGRDVVLALMHTLYAEQVSLEVATENHRAVALYESLGFIKTTELSKWYKIL